MKRSPLRAKRPTPRRNEGRVQHGRMKPKTVEPTPEQQRYHKWLRTKARCQVGRCRKRHLVIHHLLAHAPGKVGRRDHWFVVLICALHHNMGARSVHLLGSEAKFLDAHGVDLVASAVRNLKEYRRVVAPALDDRDSR
jgi:hypothetical protein